MANQNKSQKGSGKSSKKGMSAFLGNLSPSQRSALYKGLGAVAMLTVIVAFMSQYFRGNTKTLSDIARQNAENSSAAEMNGSSPGADVSVAAPSDTENDLPGNSDETNELTQTSGSEESIPVIPETEESSDAQTVTVGADLANGITRNFGDSMSEERISVAEDFYYEPLSEELLEFMTGTTFPEEPDERISAEDLRYVHIKYVNFDWDICEGELVCNAYIAKDLTEIFHELYKAEYQLERVVLVDFYDGDDELSMEANNTSCFNFRNVPDKTTLSKHSLGLAIDVNTFYNPYIYYLDGKEIIVPIGSEQYADRNAAFPYKIDTDDLCYKLFTEHGFSWGGNWNSVKDYQHFQKLPK